MQAKYNLNGAQLDYTAEKNHTTYSENEHLHLDSLYSSGKPKCCQLIVQRGYSISPGIQTLL
jgi:hypothetical protein